MVNILRIEPYNFISDAKYRKIIVFGAGKNLVDCAEVYLRQKKIEGVIDNNLSKESVEINSIEYKIQSIDEIANERRRLKEVVIFVTTTKYANDVLQLLNSYSAFDGVGCVLYGMIRHTKITEEKFDFTEGEPLIPKKLHYIWVGGRELPDIYKKNIETWMYHNPSFELIQWGEDNYDFYKDEYIKDAYENKQWGFVSSYMRYDIVEENGGIYLDTDVEVVRNLECLINDEAFVCMGWADRINTGCGFGSVKHHPLIKELKKATTSGGLFTLDGQLRSNGPKMNRVMENRGFVINNRYQRRNGVVLYPSEVMSPFAIGADYESLFINTVSIHQKDEGTRSFLE